MCGYVLKLETGIFAVTLSMRKINHLPLSLFLRDVMEGAFHQFALSLIYTSLKKEAEKLHGIEGE